jgi:hypothetical protein
MNLLAAYDRLCTALAEANSVDDLLALSNEIEHVKLYAKQVSDQRLLAEATVTQMKAERKLGVILADAKREGKIREGRPSKENGRDDLPFTLQEIGVSKDLSSRAQKRAAMADSDFDSSIETAKERIISGKINGARTLMNSREEAIDSLDYFPTPPWATRALIDVLCEISSQPFDSIWEPACGEGHIAEVLREYCERVAATDIYDYGYGTVCNFLTVDLDPYDWIITNPPFGDKTEDFVLRAIELARIGVAMFVRLQWLETTGRYEAVFRDHPPTQIAFFAERVNLCKGRWEPDGSTATAYIWLIWIKGAKPLPPKWIPPGRRECLTEPDDAERFTQHPVATRKTLGLKTIHQSGAFPPPPGPACVDDAPQPLAHAGSSYFCPSEV